MRKRFQLAATALAAVVPTLAFAQARPPAQQPRPATPPAQQPRPAARPMAAADRTGSIELTGSVGGAYRTAGMHPDTAEPQIGIGVGARVTYAINNKIGIGAGGAYNLFGGSGLPVAFAALTFTPSMGSGVSPFVTAGVGMILPRGDNLPPSVDNGVAFHGGVGIRKFFNDNTALRVEAVAHVGKIDVEQSAMGSLSVGISRFMGGGPPPDTDGDGVPDRRDSCANTPRGATVDARGCHSDTDRDGVPNGLDRCPDTPANTPVNPDGCTRDSDRDGIADNLDRCPNTAAGTPVDANGCERDADADGVVDRLDRCANTPRGTPVDAAGCPRDSDSDGVLDPADRCPSTPAGTPVDANGCPRDTDSDGVWDNRDNCPNTAPNTQVDANGCPVQRDADSDGVTDDRDRCANTPAGRRVDTATGCPLYELPAVGAAGDVIRGITFAGTATRPTLTAAARTTLDQVATAILATPGSRWEIGAFTDNRGVPATLTRRSQAQAQAVVAYLVSKGVAASQLTAVGYGSRNAIRPNTTLAGRTANRRVEIKRLQ